MSDVKMSIKELYDLELGLKAINDEKNTMKGAKQKFKYSIARATKQVERKSKEFKKECSWSKGYQDFFTEKMELRKSFANLDPKGKPVVSNNDYVIEHKRQDEFDVEIKKLEDRFKKDIEERKKIDDGMEVFLEQTFEFDLFTFDQDYIPDDILAGQLTGIILLVKEDK